MLLALHLTAHSELLLRLSLKDTTKYCLVVLAVLPALIVKPIDNKYLVYYNVYGNTVFCDWERLVEGVELPTTQPPEETPLEIPPMPE